MVRLLEAWFALTLVKKYRNLYVSKVVSANHASSKRGLMKSAGIDRLKASVQFTLASTCTTVFSSFWLRLFDPRPLSNFLRRLTKEDIAAPLSL